MEAVSGLNNRRTRSSNRQSDWSFAPESVLALVQATSAEDILQWGIETVAEATAADRVTFASREGGLLVPSLSTADDQTDPGAAFPLETSIPGASLLEGEGVVIDDREDRRGAVDVHGDSQLPGATSHRSMLCAPVAGEGVIIAHTAEPGAFTDADLERAIEVTTIVEAALRTGTTEDEAHNRIDSETLEEIGRLVSHDMINKLSIARGRIELTRRHGDFEHLEECENALKGIESIAQITATLARTGAPIERVQPVSLSSIIEEVFGSMETGKTTVSVEDEIVVQADRGCLLQILENLLRNAIEHSEKPVAIEIGAVDDGFYIEDNGPGIPEELRESVTRPGFSTRSENAGKGMTIVDRLASAHGWDMEIRDSTTGGTRIEFHGVTLE